MKNNLLIQRQGPKKQAVFLGSGISMSAAVGKAHVINSGLGQVPKYHVANIDIPDELKRFRNVLQKSNISFSKPLGKSL